MAKRVVGLEISEESVRAVEISQGRTPTLVAGGEVLLPPGAAKDSEVIDPDAVAVAVRQLWSEAKLKGKEVVLGIANRRVLVREYAAPKMRADLLKAALPFEVQDLLPVSPEQAVIDFYPIAETENHLQGLLVAAISESIEGIIGSLGKAKIKTASVDFTPFGLARIAGRVAPAGQTVAIVSVGEHTSSVVVALDGVPRFVRMLPVDLVASAMPEPTLNGDEPIVLAPTARRGMSMPDAFDSGDPAAADLVNRLRSTINFYASRPAAAPVTGLYLCGPVAARVLPVVAAAMQIPVRLVKANDVAQLGGKTAALPDGVSTGLVTTLGIVLGGGQ